MLAILSDVHANLEALTAVLDDADRHGVSEIYCLGDVVGYGPNPRECIDAIMRCKVVILGNHDQGALFDPVGFAPIAERAIFWTRAQLENAPDGKAARERRWEYLAERPLRHREGDRLFVHGSARNPLNEYVFPEDVHNLRKMERIFALVDRYCFQGHTHVPGVFVEQEPGGDTLFRDPEQLNRTYRLDDRKTLCNVGSVGQPLDVDPRACYVLLDGDTIRFRRVEYDVDATVTKLRCVPELDPFLAQRLPQGR